MLSTVIPIFQNERPVMKRLIDTDDGGFAPQVGETITCFCGIYIYTGVLSGVNDDHLELSDPKLVYDTGELNTGDWADAQDLPDPWRVMIQSIESWGAAKC